ncbi:uncharacterized protein FIBRA_03573 [Fibroporia radiculosa]|uniref:Uncharacterized protein n=1 Tax=Fibroporia radiculosa TaxID=599839 RepID=J4HW24_9APHY|nr:uncharacterized protein FIBRA_03573 [Fibroporia radiculosa]CCM01517.1 predicted protein [Fibroporia radiculosa]
MAQIGLISAELATVCSESFLYGIFFVLAVVSMYLLWMRHRDLRGPSGHRGFHSGSWTSVLAFLLAVVLIFVSTTLHWIIAVIRVFNAFVNYEGGTMPIAYYGNLSRPTEVIQSGALVFTAVVNDAMMIYRLWVVWSHRTSIVIFPLCTLLGLIACGIGLIYQFTRFKVGQDVFISALGRWLTSDAVFTLCTNLYCTVMIAWRIWRINSTLKGMRTRSSHLMSVLAIIVESSALYTVWTVFFLATYESGSNLQFVSIETLAMIAGISFMLINVRVGLGWEQRGLSTATGSKFVARSISSRALDSYSMQTMAVNISRVVERDDDEEFKSAQCESTQSAKMREDGGV